MDKKIRYIKNQPGPNGFEDDDLLINNEDSALFESFGDYMKGKYDLDDVRSDPGYMNTMAAVQDMVSYYTKNTATKENEMFIKNIFSEDEQDNSLKNEIKNIKLEINENKLNDITAEWVRDWHEKKQKIGTNDPKTEEIRSFITDAINSTVTEPLENKTELVIKKKSRSLIIRYTSLAAAALIGAFLLIRTLIPSSETLFEANYKPYDAMTTITRGVNTKSDNYSAAIEKYKTGDYQTAAIGFSSSLENDPSSVASIFFLGLSQLALKNYDQAINLLSVVADNSGEFTKEATWYLGLTYIEKGNKQKANECFEYLSKTPGYYSERSAKILRRLK